MFSCEGIYFSARLWFVIKLSSLYLDPQYLCCTILRDVILMEGCSASVISTTCILQHAVVCRVTAEYIIVSACLGYSYTRALYFCTLYCDSLCAWSHISCYHLVTCIAYHKLLVHICEPSLFRFCELDKINAILIPVLFKPFVKFDIAYSPPSRRHLCPFIRSKRPTSTLKDTTGDHPALRWSTRTESFHGITLNNHKARQTQRPSPNTI
jgi:hypothetical protein